MYLFEGSCIELGPCNHWELLFFPAVGLESIALRSLRSCPGQLWIQGVQWNLMSGESADFLGPTRVQLHPGALSIPWP